MTKRFISIVLIFVTLFSMSVCVFAAEESDTQIIYLEDGRYIVVTIKESGSRASGTKTASKTMSSTAADGTVEWQAVLKGTFTYNGTTATCTASSCTVTVYADNWYEISKTTGKSGGTATASVTMGRTFLGITVAQETYDMTLTCDKDGNLS